MLLAIDIGNTNITIGAFHRKELKRHWRISTDKSQTCDEYGLKLKGLLEASGLRASRIKGAVISSVVPELDSAFTEALSRYLGVEPLMVTPANSGMKVLTDTPSEVGSDRIVNAMAAYAAAKAPVIVVDFGTAVTFDYVTEKGEYAGGIIAPGVGISRDALFERTSKLPRVEAARPARLIGRNTVEAMQSGIFWGFVSLVDGIIERMRKEAGTNPRVLSTGGLAPLVIGESRYVTETDEFLTLKGLRLIYERKS